MPEVEVAVIGGGISGLTAAYELHRRGTSFVLLEQRARLGGVVLTDHVDGFTIDGGPDALLVQKPAAIELCQELGLGNRLISTLSPRTAFVLRRGRLHPLPESSVLGIPTRIRPLVTSGLLSPVGKFRMAMEPFLPRRATTAPDESVASFFLRRFGRETVDYIAEPLLAGIHAGDVDRLSMRALFPRLVEAEQRHGSVIQALRTLGTHRPPDGLFRSLPEGIAELTDALVETLPTDRLRHGTRVMHISGRGPFRIVSNTGDAFSAWQVVLAVPTYVSADLLRTIDKQLSDLCREIPYTSTATVVLSYKRAAVRHPLQGSGFVVPRVERPLSIIAGSWISSKWPHRAPTGQVLLRGYVGGTRDPDALERTDAQLIDDVHRDLAALLRITERPCFERVYRWPRLNPQHEVGHLERLVAIDQQVATMPKLHLVGAGFRGVGIPDCVAHGRAVGIAAAARASDTASLARRT